MFGLVWYWYVIYASGNTNTPYVDDHHQLALGELQLFRFCLLQQHHIIILTLIYSSSILFSRLLYLHSDHNLYNLYPLSTLYPSISISSYLPFSPPVPAVMADEEDRPLLDGGPESSSHPQPPSVMDSSATLMEQEPRPYELASESTPLIARRDDDEALAYGTDTTQRRSSFSDNVSKKSRSRLQWPIIFTLALLATVLAVLIFAFAAPAAVKRYAEEATVFKPTHLSIDSATSDGVRARVEGEFVVDANRVQRRTVRNLGRMATWIGREVETSQSDLEVYLPEYGNVLVGTASLPSIKVNVRNGHTNHVDVLADLATGNIPGIRAVAMDWLEGRLGQLRVKGKATLHLKSGLLSLGRQTVFKSIAFEGLYWVTAIALSRNANSTYRKRLPSYT